MHLFDELRRFKTVLCNLNPFCVFRRRLKTICYVFYAPGCVSIQRETIDDDVRERDDADANGARLHVELVDDHRDELDDEVKVHRFNAARRIDDEDDVGRVQTDERVCVGVQGRDIMYIPHDCTISQCMHTLVQQKISLKLYISKIKVYKIAQKKKKKKTLDKKVFSAIGKK